MVAVEFQVLQTKGRGEESTRKVEKRAARYNAARAASSRARRKREKSKVYVSYVTRSIRFGHLADIVELNRGKGGEERGREGGKKEREREINLLIFSLLDTNLLPREATTARSHILRSNQYPTSESCSTLILSSH